VRPGRTLLEEPDELRVELGLSPSPAGLPIPSTGQQVVPVTIDLGGRDLTIWVPPAGKHLFRQRFRELARREKRRAADAGNAANTCQIIASGVGGAIAASGVIALATAAGPLALAAIVATVVGSVTAAGGLLAGHWMNKKKFIHEERMERYSEIVEELK
jgi:hypothetical protein